MSATKQQKRSAIQALSKSGLTIEKIAEVVQVNRKTVEKWKTRTTICDQRRSGAPSLLTQQIKDLIGELCRDK